MALQIDREQLDEFCPQLFRTLDGLGLLPRQLGWKRDASGRPQRIAPTEYEKYPRLLFGSIGRYNDVEAGFKEWESRVLRTDEAQHHKEERYPDIKDLLGRMIERKEVFTKKVNLQHMRTSLYARVFQYLYPRRVLANAYCEKHKGKADVVEKFNQFVAAKNVENKRSAHIGLEQLLDSTLPDTVLDAVQKVKQTYSDEWETIVADTKASLIANGAYYHKMLRGEGAPAPPEEMEQPETEETEEETE